MIKTTAQKIYLGLIFIFLQPADNTVTPSRYFVMKPTTPDDQPWHRL